MLLTSFSFLIFFPIVFVLYYCVFGRSVLCQNIFIFLASCFFYALWDWRFLGLLLLVSLSTYYTGLYIGHCDNKTKWRRGAFILCLIVNIGLLLFFKYFNFFVTSFVDLFYSFGINLSVHTLKLLLPVGISFYVFTALSYTIDVYQNKIKHTTDILAYLSYVTFFPSILSGPISRATKQLPQFFYKRSFDYKMAVNGSKMLVWGLFVKLCVADRLGIYVDTVYGNIEQHSGATLFLTSIIYTIQIYADFSGYSLIAIGLGKLLGIDLPTNFIRPYFSKTVTEFWRRWHISLTTWFRDYIYFPLGGNRCSNIRWIINTMVVFVISGLWHGAAYTFLIWGAFHGICMILEKNIYGERIKSLNQGLSFTNLCRIGATFLIVNFAWVLFRIPNLSDALSVISRMVTFGGTIFVDQTTLCLGFLSLLILFIKDISDECNWKFGILNTDNRVIKVLTIIFVISYTLLFGVLNGGSFIYFQF